MNKNYLLSILLCLGVGALGAQVAQYSYISDRRFTSPDQLMGYDFKPAMREVPGEEPTELKVGQYSFGITRKNIYVEGGDIRGVYSLNEINTTEYGFYLKTMNARDPTIQGHLKVVVDERGQVEGLIFKRSNNDKEVIFFLRTIPEQIAAVEQVYFTDKGETKISQLDSLWTGVEVRPFLRIFNSMGGIQQRILPSDSVSLKFYHITTIEEKDNKLVAMAKGKRGRKSTAQSEDIRDEEITASTSTTPLAAFAKTEKSSITDSTAMEGIIPMLDSHSALTGFDSVRNEMMASVDTSATDVKLKITTRFYVDLNSFMRFDDGSSEMQHRTYLVNGAAERINETARPGGDKYQWELNLHKQENAYVYLDEKYNVNSIEIDGQKFYMRGQ